MKRFPFHALNYIKHKTMVLPFTSKPVEPAQPNEPPRILTEEEQILLNIDQGVHEVKEKI